MVEKMSIPDGATHRRTNQYGYYKLVYKDSNLKWYYYSNSGWTESWAIPQTLVKTLHRINVPITIPAVSETKNQTGFLRGGQVEQEINIYPFMVVGLGNDNWIVQHPNGHTGRQYKDSAYAFKVAKGLKCKLLKGNYDRKDYPIPVKSATIYPPHSILTRAVVGYNSIMKHPITVEQAQLLLDNIKFAETH